MKPIVIPASSGMATAAASVTTILVWAAKQFYNVDIPVYVAGAITGIATVLAGHFTVDTPPPAKNLLSEKDLPK